MVVEEVFKKSLEDYLNSKPGSEEAERNAKNVERLYNARTTKFRANADWETGESKREFEERIREEELAERTRAAMSEEKGRRRIDPNVALKCLAEIGVVGITIIHDLCGHTLDGNILRVWKRF